MAAGLISCCPPQHFCSRLFHRLVATLVENNYAVATQIMLRSHSSVPIPCLRMEFAMADQKKKNTALCQCFVFYFPPGFLPPHLCAICMETISPDESTALNCFYFSGLPEVWSHLGLIFRVIPGRHIKMYGMLW